METPGLFGEWLKQRRKALDLTQEELAERAGCSVFALRKIESGERRPSKQLAGLFAAALEISEDEQPTFIRLARGDINLERLRTLKPEKFPPSISDFLAQHQKTAPSHSDTEPASHHLPLPPTPLLGRETELTALERLFKDPQCRLLTLTGMGGIGKTRLAIEFALRQQIMFLDGVLYVPLDSINAAESIVPAVAEALGYSFSGPAELKEQLIKSMSVSMKRSAFLVLDNLEHLIAQSAETVELVTEFLQRLPHLKILTTSRERLNLQGEWMYELHGLPVPPVEFADKLDDYSAAVLFIQRARQIKSDFEIGGSEKSELVQICRLVEGIPLAIELAAAWVGMLTCEEIAREIESNIDFLSTSKRDVPERHCSLMATFDHSWKLLSDHEMDVLSRLSVFRGGFDRNAAEKVAGATLQLLASLVSKSLVRRSEYGRYDLHEVIRQYASSHLEQDESRRLETCDHHSEYYLDLASRYERKLKSAAQQAAMRDMTVEFDNIRTAWDWGIKRGKYESVGRAIRSFGWYFEIASLLRDGFEQLELLVQALSGPPRDAQMNKTLGMAFMQQGLLNFRSGQFMRAREVYRKSIVIFRSLDEKALLADALIFDGIIMQVNGDDYLESEKRIQEGLAYAQAANDQWFSAFGIYGLGHVDSLMGEYQKGYDQMQDGMKIWREVGDPHAISLGLNFLVNTQIKLQRYEEAKASMLESIALCEQTKNRWGMGTSYRYLGLATLAEGRYIEAQGYFQKSLEIFGESFEGWDIALSLVYLGDATLMSGDLVRAETIYREALRKAMNAHATSIAIETLVGMAQLFVQLGKVDQAYELSRHVLNHPGSMQETKDRASQVISEAENRLNHKQIEAIKEGTKNQSLEAITEMFLKAGPAD